MKECRSEGVSEGMRVHEHVVFHFWLSHNGLFVMGPPPDTRKVHHINLIHVFLREFELLPQAHAKERE